jgi:hypothetical protein
MLSVVGRLWGYTYVWPEGMVFALSRGKTRMPICRGADPNGLGTRRGLGIETKTDAAGWTGNFALACSHVVMEHATDVARHDSSSESRPGLARAGEGCSTLQSREWGHWGSLRWNRDAV